MKIENATPAQREAIMTDHPRVIVIAKPAAGKTATTVCRIERLIDQGVSPKAIAAITFTNAAAREMEERLVPKLGQHNVPLGHCGTLHSFCLRILRDHGEDIGYGQRLSIISPESASDLLASKAATLGVKTPLKDLLALKAKGRPGRGTRLDNAQTCVATYFDELKEAGIVDFDVLLTEALELIRAVLLPLGITHLFVDEVQDSSLTDWLIYKALPIANKFLVGDGDQSIYGFRGGDVSLMVACARDPQWLVLKLEDNFRSRSEICEAADRLISHNPDRIHTETRSAKGPGGMVDVLEPAINEGEEIGKVAFCIKGQLEPIGDLNPSSVAVLCRTNAIANAYRTTLAAAGIPVTTQPKSTLPKDWTFTRAFIELLADPENDALAFFFLVELYAKKGANPKEAREAAHAARKAAAMAGKTINRANLGFVRCGSMAMIPKLLADNGVSQESRMVVAESVNELSKHASILELVVALSTAKGFLKMQAKPGDVEVLTIHAAKGREFDAVFVVGCEDQIMPGRRAGVNVDEERRLFYVAATRARELLVFAHSLSRVTPWKSVETHTPSRFIAEAMGGAK